LTWLALHLSKTAPPPMGKPKYNMTPLGCQALDPGPRRS